MTSVDGALEDVLTKVIGVSMFRPDDLFSNCSVLPSAAHYRLYTAMQCGWLSLLSLLYRISILVKDSYFHGTTVGERALNALEYAYRWEV